MIMIYRCNLSQLDSQLWPTSWEQPARWRRRLRTDSSCDPQLALAQRVYAMN